MDDKQRLQLQNMIKANNVEDQTDFIRSLKHSQIIRNDVNTMIMIKSKFKGDDAKIHEECVNESNFLFSYYTDIYNKVRNYENDVFQGYPWNKEIPFMTEDEKKLFHRLSMHFYVKN
jgi:hypothetical protein